MNICNDCKYYVDPCYMLCNHPDLTSTDPITGRLIRAKCKTYNSTGECIYYEQIIQKQKKKLIEKTFNLFGFEIKKNAK